jgi:hypothetical protein
MISPSVRSVVHCSIVSQDLSTISSPESSAGKGTQLETPNIKKSLLLGFKELGDIASFLHERDLKEPRYGKGFRATTRRIGRLENLAPWNPPIRAKKN